MTTATAYYARIDTRTSRATGGMWAEELSAGTEIAGWGRVARMSKSMCGYRQVVIVEREITKRGRKGRTVTTIGDRREYPIGTRVPGTKPRTGIAAGPVHLRPGKPRTSAIGVRRNGAMGETRADRHASLIDNLTYLYA